MLNPYSLLRCKAETEPPQSATTILTVLENVEEDKKTVSEKARALFDKVFKIPQDVLIQQFISFDVSSTQENLTQVLEILLEKAFNEPHLSGYYAEICKGQVDHELGKNDGKSAFRNKLLTEVQRKFQKIILDGKGEAGEELDEEKQNIEKRNIGLVVFIGHLYRNSLLSTKMIQACFHELFSSIRSQNWKDISLAGVNNESIYYGLALLETTMDILDKENTTKVFVDQWFKKLEAAAPFCLEEVKSKIAYLKELRMKSKWFRTGFSVV